MYERWRPLLFLNMLRWLRLWRSLILSHFAEHRTTHAYTRSEYERLRFATRMLPANNKKRHEMSAAAALLAAEASVHCGIS